jgi:hypothetical protein
MSEPLEPLYTLILERGSAKPVAEIGRLLSCYLPLHPTDATLQVRYGGGLIAESLSGEKADELKSSLLGIGVRARKVEADRWAVLPRGFKAFALDFLAETILARRVSGREVVLRRDHISGLHLHGLLPVSEKKEAPEKGLDRGDDWIDLPLDSPPGGKTDEENAPDKAGLSISPGLSMTSTAFDERLSPRGRVLFENLARDGLSAMEFCLTLYLRDPVGPVRIKKNEFDYSCLKKDREEHSLDNFLLLLEKTLKYLPDAWNREIVEEFLRNLDPKKILYFKEEEAENFDRWMLQWARIEAEEGEEEGRAP